MRRTSRVESPHTGAGALTRARRSSWTACGPRLECADVMVPLDWANPRGPTITLPVVRHLASHPGRRIGSLFVNPGGPGDSGVEMAVSRGEALDAATEGRFDVVGWDIRGAGGNARVDCFGDAASRQAFWADSPIPTTTRTSGGTSLRRRSSLAGAGRETATCSPTSLRRTLPATWTTAPPRRRPAVDLLG